MISSSEVIALGLDWTEIGRDTSSTQSLQHVRKWLKMCIQPHTGCGQHFQCQMPRSEILLRLPELRCFSDSSNFRVCEIEHLPVDLE